jgi:hypothetical protein
MSPDEELAALIANRLVENGLISPERYDEVAEQIAAGKATVEDWRFWIEMGPAGQTEGAIDAQD